MSELYAFPITADTIPKVSVRKKKPLIIYGGICVEYKPEEFERRINNDLS